MLSLDKVQKNHLERTVQLAREAAEQAAIAALGQLGIGDPSPPAFLKPEERDLRRRLRIHGRQLGDKRDPKTEVQEIELLAEEVAYEHWHRMLFARFLAENGLLMFPESSPVSITLEECDEIAPEEGAANGWELASRIAAQMLPQIFRPDSPVFSLRLPPEHQQCLESLIADLPPEIFTASDSVGWVYQFWQSKRKEEVNKSAGKVGPRELPAVTQLFTEQYMVSFLLDNSLGAWWAKRRLSEETLKHSHDEVELRLKATIPRVPLEFLRFFRTETLEWSLASKPFESWPESLSELKLLDPCCGSGHFLVAAFLMLVPMRMDLEGLSARDAIERVLSDNLHGLEVDRRCIEIAAFALALSAWSYPGAGGYRKLPALNVACSGQSLNLKREDWLALGKKNGLSSYPLEDLYNLFDQAPMLGSLIDPDSFHGHGSLFSEAAANLQSGVAEAFNLEIDEEGAEVGVVAKGLAHAATMLSQKYHLVVTNVPYLKRSKQNQTLRRFCESNFSDAKEDLATVFLDRCLSLCLSGGIAAVVLPQNWLFLTSYQKFRERLLRANTWKFIARLGPKAFQTQMWDFNVQLLLVERGRKTLDERASTISGIDVSSSNSFIEKASRLAVEPVIRVGQDQQLTNPDCSIQFEEASDTVRLSEFANCYQGSGLADIARFRCYFWEVSPFLPNWVLHQSSPSGEGEYSGLRFITLWEDGKGELARSPQVTIRGRKAWNKKGIACAWMGNLPASLYGGWLFDNSAAVIVPNKEEHVLPIWCYCSSPSFKEEVRKINQKLQVANATMVKVPFDLEYWKQIAAQRYANGLPRAYSNDPTQWIFHGHPCGSVVWDSSDKKISNGEPRVDSTVLQIAVARLLGYRWPAEIDTSIELATEQQAWAEKCKRLASFADDDGIVCIPAVRGEPAASDRLYQLLAASYENSWSNATLLDLLKNSDHADKSLDSWLRDKFFVQHCQLFQQKPFIWHVWDGLIDGFSALVNYHKLDKKLLQSLIFTYLGDWISRQKQDIANNVDGAAEKLSAAEQLKKRLEQILEGEAPYDIFVRWKPIERQPLGWDPDLNDGIRLNIRPFLSVSDVRQKGCGVLRDRPNIHWNNDRGTDVESGPWFVPFDGERVNDHHLGLAEKKRARQGVTAVAVK